MSNAALHPRNARQSLSKISNKERNRGNHLDQSITDARARPVLLLAANAVSIMVHLWAAIAHSHSLWMSIFMVAMLLVCVPCTAAVWRKDTIVPLKMMFAVSGVSALVHCWMLVSTAVGSSPAMHGTSDGHMHHGTHASAAVSMDMDYGLLLLIGLEITVMCLAALRGVGSTSSRYTARGAATA